MPDLIRWFSNDTAFVALIVSMVSAIAAVVYVYLTLQLVKENRKLRELSFSPNISVYLDLSPDSASDVTLIVHNMGHGSARNVRFGVSPDLQLGKTTHLSEIALFQGIAHIAPDQSFRIYLSTSIYQPEAWPVTITAHYSSEEGTEFVSTFPLDIRPFTDFIVTPSLHEERIVSQLKQLNSSIKSVIPISFPGSARLRVSVSMDQLREDKDSQQFGVGAARLAVHFVCRLRSYIPQRFGMLVGYKRGTKR